MTRILLAGGGHTHLIAGPLVAAASGAGARVTLLAPAPRLLYSGMMPGWLAGQYRFDECAIDLRAVAVRSGLEWVEDTLVDVDFPAREAIGAGGRRHRYDLLSLNVGSANLIGEVAPGSSVRVIGAKPFAGFVAGWADWIAQPPTAARCVVIGGGAAAFEIACALAALCRGDRALAGGSVTLASTGASLLAGQSRLAARLADRTLRTRGVAVHLGMRYVGVRGDRVVLRPEPRDDAERELPADLVIVANGARPPGWLTAAARRDGRGVSPDGGLAVDDCLRAIGDDRVFGSGDCASFVESTVPKSGVHALRQGRPLAASIAARARRLEADTQPAPAPASTHDRRPSTDHGTGTGPGIGDDTRGIAAVSGEGSPTDAPSAPGAVRPRPHALPGDPCAGTAARYVPQARALALLNRCDGTAIVSWGPLGAAGSFWWRLKDRIDRRFTDRFRGPDGDTPV
jgi:NADH dehydrogenase FAD-containing subunit